ncbi:hypothetical protein [Streptomyces sp. CoH27]|uniref:hypothetical protein n=1 Tax=Streptomyces sp. CoH27 TaxID=2875763 RepID=UPI001CD5869F|nr:hypothetical protein [Streptomyces sp. CoH27]
MGRLTVTRSGIAASRAGTASALPAHRDGNVRRWLAAYTSSMLGDSVYYLALS